MCSFGRPALKNLPRPGTVRFTRVGERLNPTKLNGARRETCTATHPVPGIAKIMDMDGSPSTLTSLTASSDSKDARAMLDRARPAAPHAGCQAGEARGQKVSRQEAKTGPRHLQDHTGVAGGIPTRSRVQLVPHGGRSGRVLRRPSGMGQKSWTTPAKEPRRPAPILGG